MPPTSFFHPCPCDKKECHLGIFVVELKQSMAQPKPLNKVQREFFLGHGIQTKDKKEAGNIFLNRDHKKIAELIHQYSNGKLGVYMVPSMFFGENSKEVKLSEYKISQNKAGVMGDIAEKTMFYALKSYYSKEGDDVLIVHSHKFLSNGSVNEKDFIAFNLTKG